MVFLHGPLLRASLAALTVVTAASALVQAQGRGQARNPGETDQITQELPQGTEESPLMVQVQPARKADAESVEERRKRDRETSDGTWTRGLAIATVLLGLFQLGAIALQVYIAKRQNSIIESQSLIMKGQRDASEQQSGYMKEGLAETRRANEAAREAVVLAHRPRIVLRNVDVPDVEGGGRAGGRIWATNVGFAVAKVIKFDAQWHIGEQLPTRNPYARAAPTKTYIKTIYSGNSRSFKLPDIPVVEDLAAHRAIFEAPDVFV